MDDDRENEYTGGEGVYNFRNIDGRSYRKRYGGVSRWSRCSSLEGSYGVINLDEETWSLKLRVVKSGISSIRPVPTKSKVFPR